jgi:hypothetical protein
VSDDKIREPKCALLVMCAHCGQGVEAPLPIDRDAFARLLAERGWFVSVLTPPSQDGTTPMLLGALCNTCAPNIFPPEVLKAAEERRQQLLRGAR